MKQPVVNEVKAQLISFEEHVYPGAFHEVFNETNQAEVIADVIAFVQRILAQK